MVQDEGKLPVVVSDKEVGLEAGLDRGIELPLKSLWYLLGTENLPCNRPPMDLS